ncbi:MAG: GtrA family protein [Oscillospiraceae bacterium]|nr:GtrA family protein [Oscillospiraceae bacterium]
MKAHITTLVKFGLFGVVNTAIDWLVSVLLVALAHAPEWLATALGYCCGIACSYLLNGRFTFKARGRVPQFIAVNAVSLAVSIGLAKLFSEILHPFTAPILTFKPSTLDYMLSKAITVCVTMAINFIGYRKFVFVVTTKTERD